LAFFFAQIPNLSKTSYVALHDGWFMVVGKALKGRVLSKYDEALCVLEADVKSACWKCVYKVMFLFGWVGFRFSLKDTPRDKKV
jgi:hypothetical protein